jgi:hypothetical protein
MQIFFHQSKINFLGYIISNNGLSMDLEKFHTIVNYQTLIFVCDVQFFWDLQTFIIFLSKTIQKIVATLTWLTNKDKFKWDKKIMKIFKYVKNAFITTFILIHTNTSNPLFLEAYASKFSLGAMLS